MTGGGTALISGGRETIELSTPPFRGRTELRELKVSWNELSDLLKVILEERIQKDTTLTSPSEPAPAEALPVDTLFEELAPTDTPQDSLEVAADSLLPTPPNPVLLENIPYYVTVINPEVDRAYYLAQTTVEEVSSKNRELSEIYEEGLNNSQAFLRTILLGTFIANLIALIVGTFVIGSYLINPLKDIAATAKDVASGDTRTQVVYHRKDEIGEVADSLNLIVDSFRQYTEFADNVGKENFASSFEVKSEKDTLGFTLLKMRDSLKAAADEDQKRNWANEGFAQFSAILRSNEQDLEEFSYGIISNLVKYLDANQGGLFIMTESEPPVLEMKAAFAYNKRKYDEKQIQIGQGLLGQVVLEKDLIYLDNAPDEYVQITSGLGRANPRHVLICPLMVNEDVLGALEIASFKPLPPHELEFVRRLSENIASTLRPCASAKTPKSCWKKPASMPNKCRPRKKKCAKIWRCWPAPRTK
ncbi:MAG: GAF domain-containing protein [Microscillaceae bacterium]|nr:GAF domain-containing protein [Microscillaceae bacterium]